MLSHINVGVRIDCSIRELVETVAKVVGFTENIKFDKTKPDGSPRKLMNADRLQILSGFIGKSKESGLTNAYQWYR